jgi:hypothetical protein
MQRINTDISIQHWVSENPLETVTVLVGEFEVK